MNPKELNGDGEDAYSSVSSDGTLYFTSNRSGGLGGYDLYRSKLIDGKYTIPENLGDKINTSGDDYPSYIDPNGRFIVFCKGYKMFISYDKNGNWTEATGIALKENPSELLEGQAPYISPNQKYLFFEGQGDFYQVDLDETNIEH